MVGESSTCLSPNHFKRLITLRWPRTTFFSGVSMFAGLYKPGQGYYTRLLSLIGLSLIVLMGVAWMWKLLANTRFGPFTQPVYVQALSAVVLVAVFGAIAYVLIGRKPRVVEFMIATESEMKKVNWSSRREIMGSTWVVIGLTIFLAMFCFGFDFAYAWVFRALGVLGT
jgi:preprotein translocase SecE subunit